MREVKFRVWNERYSEYIRPDYNIIGYIYPLDGTLGVSSGEQDDYIVEQYTGLKDKNGKEIYEGDIIDAVDLYKPADVAWHNTKAGFFVFHEADDWYFPICNLLDVEVIGNIHENPELLEEE